MRTSELHIKSWDFKKAFTKYFTHCYHYYPAMMIPQVARGLLNSFHNGKPGLLFDPFCGTGTSLVEGILGGFDVIGTDLNPLARIIAKTKCTLIDEVDLEESVEEFRIFLSNHDTDEFIGKAPNFKNIEFWFDNKTILELTTIKYFIDQIERTDIKNFFKVAFSETIRESSYTKAGEFKLVRKKGKELENHNPDTFKRMMLKLRRNQKGNLDFRTYFAHKNWKPKARILDINTVENIPEKEISGNSVDLIITSPPYGDSTTTVAYGQFSRLSNQWLGIEDAFRVDKKLMGGVKYEVVKSFDLNPLDAVIMDVDSKNPKRAKEVYSFYEDLRRSCENLSRVVKPLGCVCYVVSNRKVQGITLPTDSALTEFFMRYGFNQIAMFDRNIPNKRMPSRNSPTNVAGLVDATMTKEKILVFQKISYN